METTDIPAEDGDQPMARTTTTSFRIIEAMKQHETVGVSALAAELGLAKGTVHKHLNTLRHLDYVVKDGTKYRLSVSFLGLGTAVRARLPIYQLSQPPLETLASATDEIASLMIPEHGYGIYIRRVGTDNKANLDAQEGERLPLHATAGGKAILSYTPVDERERILDRRGLPALTENTITDREAFADELQLVRDRRISYDRAEYRDGWHCVGCPITNRNNRAVGAITVSGPTDRMTTKDATTDFASIVGSTVSSLQNKLYDTY